MKEPPLRCATEALVIKFWHLPTLPGLIQVPSAVRGLTALFGMGRGEHPPYGRHEGFCSI